MAAPNILTLTTVLGKSGGAVLGTSSADLLTNAAASGKVLKVNILTVSNKFNQPITYTLAVYDVSAVALFYRAFQIVLPAGATIEAIEKAAPIYLEEGDKITGLASDASAADAVWSYEDMS